MQLQQLDYYLHFQDLVIILLVWDLCCQQLNYQTEFKKLNDIYKKSTILDENGTSKIEFNKNILLKNLSFKYENKDNLILDNINLEINKGSCVAFVGKSGSGKTTLINIIACLLKSTHGEILIDDKSINNSEFCKKLVYYLRTIT